MQAPQQLPPAPPQPPMSNTTTNRRTHRKKTSNLRLSSDTTSTLPEYLPAAVWTRSHTKAVLPDGGAATGELGMIEDDALPEDRPPDYSDSAEEADEDTDTERSKFIHNSTQPHGANYQSLGVGMNHVMAPVSPLPVHATGAYQPPSSPTPWRRRRYGHSCAASTSSFQHHRRKQSSASGVMPTSFHTPAPSFSSTSGLPPPPPQPSSTDPYLDSLLERSVHALEMSNNLLQTSMTTQTGLSNTLVSTPEMPTTRPTTLDYNLEQRARGLQYRLQDTRERHEAWVDELEELKRGVDSLFDEEPRRDTHGYRDGYEYGEGRRDSWKRYSNHSMEGSISSSMPTASPISRQPPTLAPGLERSSSTSSRHLRTRRKPSLELQRHHPSYTHGPTHVHHPTANNHFGHSGSFEARMDASDPRLRYGAHQHSNLVAPPPRALTQYVTVTTTEGQDEHEEGDNHSFGDSSRKTRIDLPSTMGLRASASSHFVPKASSVDLHGGGDDETRERGGAVSRTSNVSSGGGLTNSANVNFHAAPSSPRITKLHSQPTTPAYNMLSSFVQKPPTAPPEPPAAPLSSTFSSNNPALAAVASISAFITRSRSRRGSSVSANGNADAPQANSSANVPTSTPPRTQQGSSSPPVQSRGPSRRLSVPILASPSPSRKVTNYSAGSSPAVGVGFDGDINGALRKLKAASGSYHSKQGMNTSISGSPNTTTTMLIRYRGEVPSGQGPNMNNTLGDIRVEEGPTSKSLSSGYTDGTNNVTLPPSSALFQPPFPGSVGGINNPKDMSHRDQAISLAHSVLPVPSSGWDDSTVQLQLPPHSQSKPLAQSQSHLPVSRQRSQGIAITMSPPHPIHIPTTPKMVIRRTLSPTEEEGEEKANLSESSSDGCRAKMTVVSLRKILDDQDHLVASQQQQQSSSQRRNSPSPSPSHSAAHSPSRGRRPPSSNSSLLSLTSQLKPPPLFLMPLVPAPAVEAGTSNATASVSRLLTKNLHTASTRPPSPPRQSAMKRTGSVQQVIQVEANAAGSSQNVQNGEVTREIAGEGGSGNGLRLATAVSLMAGVMNSVKRATSVTPSTPANGASRTDGTPSPNGIGSAPGSGRSTPKRISFAELPESYASTRPEGSARFRELKKQSSRRKSKSNGDGKGKKRESLDDKTGSDGGGWLSKFLVGAASASAASGPGGPVHGLVGNGTEERYEERMSRSSWGGGGRFSGIGGGGSGLGPGFGSSGYDEWSV